jgi:hypothetical protein
MRSCREVAQVPNFEGTERGPELLAGSVPAGARALVTTEITGTRRHRPGRDWQNAAAVRVLPLAAVLVPRAPRLALAATWHDARRSLRGSKGRAGHGLRGRPGNHPPRGPCAPTRRRRPGRRRCGLSHGAVPSG